MTLPRSALAASALALATFVAACADWRGTMQEATYGPSFEYISPEQLKSTMWQMARDTRDLETLLAQRGPVSDVDRKRALALLDALYDESERLGSEGIRTNHPLLDDDRDRFRADIATARRGVQSEPPSYEVARTVSAACVHCHNRSMH
jgi:hypothetical protein